LLRISALFYLNSDIRDTIARI